MLGGIKKGKRKRKEDKKGETGGSGSGSIGATQTALVPPGPRKKVHSSSAAPNVSSSSSSDANRKAAEELRRMLAGPGKISLSATKGTTERTSCAASASTSTINDAIDRFEQRRGKLAMGGEGEAAATQESSEKVLIMSSSAAPAIQKEDLRNGSRKGKIKQKESYLHSNADASISDMVAEERRSQQEGSRSMDEVFARNIARLGSRYKGSEFKSVAGASAGVDEDDLAGDGGIDMKMFTSNEDRLTGAAKYNREISRKIAHEQKAQSITSRCWWWMESSSFQKHRLLSLGDHVSMVLVPSHLSLVPSQCYLVPVQHAESFASCEDEVWSEISHFRAALRRMFQKEGKGVLFCETVLPSKGLWQARMDVIPVSKDVEHDAEIYFKSALTEEAEEWGTHTKILSTRGKGLRRTIPKGFSYFNVEWKDGGFAQIIENQSKSFPKDFGLDTIAGMMELEPMKYNRKPKAVDHDRGAVLDFLGRWKEFDWTLSLDEGK